MFVPRVHIGKFLMCDWLCGSVILCSNFGVQSRLCCDRDLHTKLWVTVTPATRPVSSSSPSSATWGEQSESNLHALVETSYSTPSILGPNWNCTWVVQGDTLSLSAKQPATQRQRPQSNASSTPRGVLEEELLHQRAKCVPKCLREESRRRGSSPKCTENHRH